MQQQADYPAGADGSQEFADEFSDGDHGDDAEGYHEDDMRIPECTKHWEVELPEACVCLSISPKGKLIAAATAADEILVIDADSGEIKFTLAGHCGGTHSVAFLTGVALASCGDDGCARIWNIARGACLAELPIDGVDADRTPSGHTVAHLTVAPAAKSFAVASGKSVVQFTVVGEGASPSLPQQRDFGALPSTVESLRFERNGYLLAAYNGGVTAWDLTNRSPGEKQALDLPYDGACLSVDMSPAQDFVVAGCHDASVHIFQFVTARDTGVDISEMSCGGYESKVTLTEFSPDGRWMASVGGARATVWDFSDSPAGSMPTLCMGHRSTVTCQAWQALQPDGVFLLTGCKGGEILMYDVEAAVAAQEGHPKIALPGVGAPSPGDEVTGLVWGREGWFFSGHISGHVRGWQLPLAEGQAEQGR